MKEPKDPEKEKFLEELEEIARETRTKEELNKFMERIRTIIYESKEYSVPVYHGITFTAEQCKQKKNKELGILEKELSFLKPEGKEAKEEYKFKIKSLGEILDGECLNHKEYLSKKYCSIKGFWARLTNLESMCDHCHRIHVMCKKCEINYTFQPCYETLDDYDKHLPVF